MSEGKIIYYAVPRQVQEYAIRIFQDSHSYLSFPRALAELQRMGHLSTTCPPFPPFLDNMTSEEFDDLLLSLPFDATNIIENDRRTRGGGTLEESSMFPWEKDVFCFKHMPYMDRTQHCHNYFEITYICRGTCRLLFENESILLTEGEMCIIPPLSPHNQPLEPDCIALGIVVRKSTFDSIFGELMTHTDLVSTFFRNSLYDSTQTNYLILKTELLPRLRDIIYQLAYECSRDDPYANTCSVSLLNLFLALTLRRYRDTITIYRMEDLTRNHHDFPLILQYIQQNFRSVTLESLARVFNYSESHLCRLIQHNLNQTFTVTVRNLKMTRAQDYLENTQLKVAEIADLVGYESVDHFSRTFKKTFGTSPLEYRKEHRNKPTSI